MNAFLRFGGLMSDPAYRHTAIPPIFRQGTHSHSCAVSQLTLPGNS